MTVDQIKDLAKEYEKWVNEPQGRFSSSRKLEDCFKDLRQGLGINRVDETYEVLGFCSLAGQPTWRYLGSWPRLIKLGPPGSVYPPEFLEIVYAAE